MNSKSRLPPDFKILIVDDMPTLRDEITKVLKTIGFINITQAIDGKDAWSKLTSEARVSEPFEMLLTDINMPIEVGANNYILKPYTPETVREKIIATIFK